MKEKIIRSGGNVFADLGFPPEEAAVLSMRADLMAQLRLAMENVTGRRLKRPGFWASANPACPT